jgi:CheY-like chemotaxis protein
MLHAPRADRPGLLEADAQLHAPRSRREKLGFGRVAPGVPAGSLSRPRRRLRRPAPRRRRALLLIDDDARHVPLPWPPEQARCRAHRGRRPEACVIAAEKPDVIVHELGLTGSMAGQDVVNVIKATMEWVDIPIVLYTREPVASQKEARQVHGADEVVSKGPGSPAVLVQRVISLFRRG